MEIERKFLVAELPADLDRYPFHRIEQYYLNIRPVVRVRREDDQFYLTYKGQGLMVREEYNLPLDEASYEHLAAKADGAGICKRRFLIPDGDGTIELDVFDGAFAGLLLAEREFNSEEEALAWQPRQWMGREVTREGTYSNSRLSRLQPEQIRETVRGALAALKSEPPSKPE